MSDGNRLASFVFSCLSGYLQSAVSDKGMVYSR